MHLSFGAVRVIIGLLDLKYGNNISKRDIINSDRESQDGIRAPSPRVSSSRLLPPQTTDDVCRGVSLWLWSGKGLPRKLLLPRVCVRPLPPRILQTDWRGEHSAAALTPNVNTVNEFLAEAYVPPWSYGAARELKDCSWGTRHDRQKHWLEEKVRWAYH